MVGIYQMSFAMGDFIMKKFPSAKYVDASELVDRVKGDQERRGAGARPPRRDHAGRLDAAAFAAIKPGMRDNRGGRGRRALQPGSRQRERHLSLRLGASGTAAKFGQRHVQNRTIKKGDTLALLVEDSGPGAMFTELGRSCVLGECRSR